MSTNKNWDLIILNILGTIFCWGSEAGSTIPATGMANCEDGLRIGNQNESRNSLRKVQA